MSELETIRLSLKDKIVEFAPDRDGWIIVLKGDRINSIKVARSQVGLSLDFEWHFVAPVVVYEEVTERRARLYRELKRREAQTLRRGWIRYSYTWITSTALKENLPEVTPLNDLVERLNNDTNLQKLLRRSVVDELHVNTYFSLDWGIDPKDSIRRHYQDPEKVGWLLTAIKGPGSEWRFASIVRRIYELLEYLAGRLSEFTYEVERELF